MVSTPSDGRPYRLQAGAYAWSSSTVFWEGCGLSRSHEGCGGGPCSVRCRNIIGAVVFPIMICLASFRKLCPLQPHFNWHVSMFIFPHLQHFHPGFFISTLCFEGVCGSSLKWFSFRHRNPCFLFHTDPDVNVRGCNERLVRAAIQTWIKSGILFICFASCLILGDADNQQGRGVKCIINYWEGATSLLELILMLPLPLWVMWGVKYFSGDRGAAPQHSFAYQTNSRARWRCQPRRLCYM